MKTYLSAFALFVAVSAPALAQDVTEPGNFPLPAVSHSAIASFADARAQQGPAVRAQTLPNGQAQAQWGAQHYSPPNPAVY
jgi:hypothetical protein